MPDLKSALRAAVDWCGKNAVDIPLELQADLARLTARKAIGDITATIAEYHDAITQAIVDYFTGDRRIQEARGDFKHAATNGLGDAFETGWLDGGQELPLDPEAVDWLAARQEQEFGFIDQLFVQAKELKQEKDFDYFAWATERADGYAASAGGVYNEGKLFAAKNKLLTWVYGETEHCETCEKLNGQRHRASWFVSRNYIPRQPGAAMECGGYRCMCSLIADDGEEFTI